MLRKKAQGEIITTVLIILLVLAAIVIVWQVVNSTVKAGGEQISKQTSCIGVSMEVTAVGINGREFSIKRTGGGGISPTPSVRVLADGVTATCTWVPAVPAWEDDFTAARCTFAAAPTESVEAALVLDGGTVCSVTGKLTI